VVFDELVHASVHSGMRASRVELSRRRAFAHNDPESLRIVLRELMLEDQQCSSSSTAARPTVFLALESLYSMDGDFSPLPALLDVMDDVVPREMQCVVLDEAHSTGLYGVGGRGIGYALGEHDSMGRVKGDGRIGVRLMTFGKAVGGSGGESSLIIRRFRHCPTRAGSDMVMLPSSDEYALTPYSRLVMLANYPVVSHQLCPASDLLHCSTTLDRGGPALRMGYSRESRRRQGELR
jgi:hypothetical protein